MYLKVECPLELRQLAQLLAPDATPDSFEQVSEELYVTLPELPFALNLSRVHGGGAPGPVYIVGWDRGADREIESLPDWLAQHIADELLVTVLVYSGSVNRDRPESQPIDAVRPHLLA